MRNVPYFYVYLTQSREIEISRPHTFEMPSRLILPTKYDSPKVSRKTLGLVIRTELPRTLPCSFSLKIDLESPQMRYTKRMQAHWKKWSKHHKLEVKFDDLD